MSIAPATLRELTGTAWVHAFEQDAGGDEVYCRAGEPIPPARRPRERLQLHPDGTATIGSGGADDRTVRAKATWTVDGDHIVVHRDAPAPTRNSYRITVITATQLRVRVT